MKCRTGSGPLVDVQRSGWPWLAMAILAGMLVGIAHPSLSVAQPGGGSAAPEVEIPTASVEIDGRVLFRVRGFASFPAEQRAAGIQQRIEAAARDRAFQLTALREIESEGAIAIMAGDRTLMRVVDADARMEQVAQKDVARLYRERIRSAIEDYRRARRPDVLLRGTLYALGATITLAILITLVVWLGHRLDAAIARRVRRHIRSLGIQSFQILRAEHIWGALRGALRVARVLAILALLIPFLEFVLLLFPWTRSHADQLTDLVTGPLGTMGRAVLAHIPGLIFLAILFMAVRFGLQLMRLFFDGLAQGSVTIAGFEPEWAQPTYKMARLAVVALAVVVAYPYIPGSDSAAFKGISLFLGVVFSLGSSSAISNLIAGYSMTYRRAFKVGDRVKIGEVMGDVTGMRLQATHLRSLKNEEVIVPNSLILNSQVINYSSVARTQGLILHTTVGIGYETPWRQVEAMLLLAAERTPELLRDPRPFVLQTSLGDFAVNYELNAYCGDAQRMMPLYTELHRNVLDIFNEYGVQIMTPAYENDPMQPKLVAKDQWYAAPAAPDVTPGGAGDPARTGRSPASSPPS